MYSRFVNASLFRNAPEGKVLRDSQPANMYFMSVAETALDMKSLPTEVRFTHDENAPVKMVAEVCDANMSAGTSVIDVAPNT